MIEKRQPVFIEGHFATLRLTRGLFAIVDVHRFAEVNKYRWKAVRSSHNIYAARKVIRNGIEKQIFLHRVIAKTPPGCECHHDNRYTLDCRESNLVNKTPSAHRAEHTQTWRNIFFRCAKIGGIIRLWHWPRQTALSRASPANSAVSILRKTAPVSI